MLIIIVIHRGNTVKKISGILAFLTVSIALSAQSRDDITVYVAPTTGGTAEDQSYFDENIKMEVAGANYVIANNKAGADYTINLKITEEEDWDDPYIMINILNISLEDNSDGHEVVQFAWEYKEIEEMYEWNLHLIYAAMANVPLTKLTAVPDTNHWRNKWLYLVGYGYANFQFGFFDESLISDVAKRNRAPYTFYLSPAVGISLEFQFLSFMSAEIGFLGAQQNFGGDSLSGMKFVLPLLLKLPIKPSRHFMLEPYAGIQANLSTNANITPSTFSWVAGFQYGVRGGERGALLIDLRLSGGLSDTRVYTSLFPGEATKPYLLNAFDVYFGIGFKVGFYNRNKTDIQQ
jgi:hypothetical protein